MLDLGPLHQDVQPEDAVLLCWDLRMEGSHTEAPRLGLVTPNFLSFEDRPSKNCLVLQAVNSTSCQAFNR